MSREPLLEQLISAFTCLPGVGVKTAQRMSLALLERKRDAGLYLASVLEQALKRIQHCQRCRNYTEDALCQLCQNTTRDPHFLCVVETPADLIAIEQTHDYRGLYFVLMGHLSPLDNIGPADLGLPLLAERLAQPELTEVILATNPTVEGETTAHFIAEMAKKQGKAVSRLAHGLPMGGEVEYMDPGTLTHAFRGRRVWN